MFLDDLQYILQRACAAEEDSLAKHLSGLKAQLPSGLSGDNSRALVVHEDSDGISGRNLPYITQHIHCYEKKMRQTHTIIQNCDHFQSVFRNQSPYQLQAELAKLTIERNTWLLLKHLRRCEEADAHSPHAQLDEHTDADRDMNIDRAAERFSHLRVINRIKKEDTALARNLAVVEWLEEVAKMDTHIDERGYVSLKRTRRKLQQSMNMKMNRAGGMGAAASEALDPDAEFRLRTDILERQDRQEEEVLLRYVWQLIRAGELEQAVQLCRKYNQHWRAATLRGGRYWDDQQEANQVHAVRGNRRRRLWKSSCRQMANANRVSRVEAAIYGLLGGHLEKVLPQCSSWEDACWARFKLASDVWVDCHLAIHLYQQKQADDSFKQVAPNADLQKEMEMVDQEMKSIPTPAAIFEEIAKHSPSPARAQSQSQSQSQINTTTAPHSHTLTLEECYRRIQSLIVLNQYDLIALEMADFITVQLAAPAPSSSTSNKGSKLKELGSFLLFATHLYLYFHPSCPQTEELSPHGVIIVTALINHLIESEQHQHVAYYAALLPNQHQIEQFSSFLRGVPDLAKRRALLEQAQLLFPHNVLTITKRLVQNILTDTTSSSLHVNASMDTTINSTSVQNSTTATLATPARTPMSLAQITAQSSALSSASTALTLDSTPAHTRTHPLPHAASSDRDKILAIDCFDISQKAQLQEALYSANLLFRCFVQQGKINSAKLLAGHLASRDLHASLLSEYSTPTPTSGVEGSDSGRAAPEIQDIKIEHMCWRQFVACLDSYSAWQSHHLLKPKAPQRSQLNLIYKLSSSSVAEELRQQQRMSALISEYQLELEQWQREEQRILKITQGQFIDTLTMEGGRFLIAQAPVAEAEAATLASLRQICVPQLIFLLQRMCHEAGEYKSSQEVADLVADERYQLFLSFSKKELKALLERIAESALQVALCESNIKARAANKGSNNSVNTNTTIRTDTMQF